MVQFKDIIVYTCVTKGYDWLRPVVPNEEEGIEFVCFTDRPDKLSRGWRMLPLQSPPRLHDGHDINRFHKVFPHHLFPSHRYSIYIDGNMEYLGGYKKLVDRFKNTDCALGAFRHPDMHNTISEANACWSLKKFDKYDLRRSEEQIQVYKTSEFDVSMTIAANYLLVRDHQHPHIHSAMSLWWSHLFEYTKRDQMSLFFALWKENVPFIFLDDVQGVESERLQRHPHKSNPLKTLRKKICRIKTLLTNHAEQKPQ